MSANVLVVEDEGVVALDIIQELESVGYSVLGHVTTGEDAIAKAEALRPDVILMDVNIQGEMDGITAAEKIGASTGTPVIFVTAHADEVTLQRAKLTRPFGYIIKPFEPNELRANIEITMHRASSEPHGDDHDSSLESQEDVSIPLGGIDEYKFESIKAISLFEGMTQKDIHDLASVAVIQDINAGEFVSMDGEKPQAGFMVLSGRLAVVKSTVHGKELTLDLLIPGDVTGILRALEPMDMDTSVRGQIDAKILSIPSPQLKAVVERNPAVFRKVALELMQRSRRANDLALGLAHSRVESRIVSALIALAPRFGRPGASDDQTRIFLTRKELADLTGTTPETAIRVTKNLEREGLLDLTKPGVIKILSLKQLREAVE